jgi:excinuclease ABC subunit C
MLLLARLRDEAHRFAIAYQRKLLRRERVRSALEDIPGVGVERRTALLRHFGSLDRVRRASVEELSRVKGIGPGMARTIHVHLHRPGRDRRAAAVHSR